MKQFILILFVLLPFSLFSQVNESFDGTELDAAWFGKDRDSFCINDAGRLQLNINPIESGHIAIGRKISYSADMEWEFDVYMQWAPSDQNKLCVYLYQENGERFYYLRIGNNGTKDLGFRRHGETELVTPQSDFKEYPLLLRVKVTLEDNRQWTLYYKTPEMSGYRIEGRAIYPIEEPVEQGILNLTFHYSKTRSTLFSIDNLRISNQITATPLEEEMPDEPGEPESLPELSGIELLSLSNLLFSFDQPVDISEARFSISDIGDAYQIRYVDSDRKTTVSAFFDAEMQPDRCYTISYSGLQSLSGTLMPDFSEEFILRSEEGDDEEEDEPEKPDRYPEGTVIFNEVMANPGDGGWVEYIELYNTSSRSVGLADWKYRNVNGKKTKQLPNVTLPANGYALLWDDRFEWNLPAEVLAIPVEKFPTLNNQGATLQLWDAAGNLIDELSYEKATAARSWERGATGSWHLSTDRRGGTPGAANSSPEGNEEEDGDDEEEPGEPDRPELPVAGEAVQPGAIVLNELLPNPYPDGCEYIELYNRSGKPLDVSSLSLAVRKSDGTLNTRYPLSGVTRPLDADGYLLVAKHLDAVTPFYDIRDESALWEIPKLPFLTNTASTLVLFRTADETIIDEVSYSSKWHAYAVKNQKGVALERIDPDGATQDAGNWTSAATVAGYGTPGYQNSQYRADSKDEPTGIEAPVWKAETGEYTIAYELDRPGYSCRAFVFNIAGQWVAEIANNQLLGTSGTFHWNGTARSGSPLPTGIYIFYAEIYHPDGEVKPYKKVFLVR